MTFPWMRGVLAAAGVLAVTACSDVTGGGDPPDADVPSNVAVQVYVDTDYSGTLNDGDDRPLNVPVRLVATSAGGAVVEDTTDWQGIARMQVAPGTYEVILPQPRSDWTRTEPLQVTVSAPREGAELQASVRFIRLPGAVAGAAYRDDNLNNRRDAGEPGAAGVSVKAYTDQALTRLVRETTVAADGSYALYPMPPGVPYYVKFDDPGPGLRFEKSLHYPVYIAVGDTTRISVRYAGGPVESIASAKQKPVGTVVTVEGVALTRTWSFTCVTGYVQDSTAGIQADANCGGMHGGGDSPGSPMRITGRLYSVNGEIGVGRSIVQSAASWPAPAPTRLITGAEAAARTYEGSHVRIDSLRVVSVHDAPGGSSPWNFDVRVQAPDGTLMYVRVRNGDNAGLYRNQFVPGFTFDARGPIGSHDGTPHIWLNSSYDMFPR